MSEQNKTQSKLKQPEVRGFQLDSSAIGDVSNSVNLYRGDVNLPLKLVSLPGPNGLNLDISAFYESNITQQVDTWNLEAPTGVLGLGWTLPYDYILFAGNGTASWLEGEFYLHLGGNPYRLVLIEKTGTDDNIKLTFAVENFPLWEIYFWPGKDKEKWQVKQDNGKVLIFGDKDSGRYTVQWGVRWGNWAGSSTVENGNPEQFGIAWNLSTVTDQRGNTLTYEYQNDDLQLTQNQDIKYTRASYLKRVIDAVGRQVEFYYCPKDTMEYSPLPHFIPDNGPCAYQDRYETYYLALLVVRSPLPEGQKSSGFDSLPSSQQSIETIGNEENVYYKIEFETKAISLDDSGMDSAGLTNTSKRYLLSVKQARGNRTIIPGMKFHYDLKKSSDSRGKLLSVQYPEGGEARWNYENVDLSDIDIFSLEYNANRPEGSDYKTAVPRIWFGADYIIVIWSTRSNMQVQVFSYGGHWTEPYTKDLSVNINDQDHIHVAASGDFFILFFHNEGNTTDYLYRFQKKQYQFGKWKYKSYEVELNTSNVIEEETALVAGKNFAALHVGGTLNLHRWRYNRKTKVWTRDSISGKSSSSKMSLAAQNDILFASFYVDTDNGSYDQVFYLDEQYNWRFSDLSNIRKFEWNPIYVSTYWRTGQGFCAATYLNDGKPATIIITRWNRAFSEFKTQQIDGDSNSYVTYINGSTMVNGGIMFRFNGEKWVQDSLGWDYDTYMETAVPDRIIKAQKSGSLFDPCWVFPFDPWENSWVKSEYLNDQQRFSNIGPVFQGNYLTVGDWLYYLDSGDGKFKPVKSPLLESHLDVNTVTNRGPVYIAFQDNSLDPDKVRTYIALLMNGSIKGEPVQFEGKKFYADEKSGMILAGPNAFVTYDPNVAFKDTRQFTLHRILNHTLEGVQKDCVVSSVEIHSDSQVYKTKYTYDTTKAVFDPSGQVMQYPQVTAEQKCGENDNDTYGKTEYLYYNGLSDQLTNEDEAIREYYSLTNGILYEVKEYDDGGNLVTTTTNRYQPVTLTEKNDGGFALLSNCVELVPRRNTNTVHNQPTISLGEAGAGNYDIIKEKTMEYDPATAQLTSTSSINYNSRGEQETRKSENIYAWTIPGYESMKNPPADKARILDQVTQTTFFLKKQGAEGFEPVQSYVTTYKNDWKNHPGSWGTYESYNWKGGNAVLNQTPVFDYDPPHTGQWLKMSTQETLSKAGLVSCTSNGLEVSTTTLFDKKGVFPVAGFVNGAVGQVSYTGFQEYETDQGWKTSSGDPINYFPDDSHTGERSVVLKGGSGSPCLKNKFSAVPGPRRYVFASWTKTMDKEVDAYWEITVGSKSKKLIIPTSNPGEWNYSFTYIDLENSGPVDITIQAVNNSENKDVLIDDIHFSPVDCSFTATVYDHVHFLQTAQMGSNGETNRTFYNNNLQAIANSGPDENISSLVSTYFSRNGNHDEYQSNDPNSNLQIQARLGGPYDDFRDKNWTNRWTSDKPADWQVKNQALVHVQTTSTADWISYKGSDKWRDYGVRVGVNHDGQVNQPLGIEIGGRIKVQWNPVNSRWELLDNGTVVRDAENGTAPFTASMDWLLVVRPSSVIFYMDGRQILQYIITPGNAVPIGGSLKFFTADSGVSFSRVLVLKKPVIGATYLGSTKLLIQEQQLLDNQVIVRQSFYDALGRETIQTKPAIYENSVLGYRPDFVQDFNPLDPGTMGGDIARFYPDDGGYPYNRSRIESSSLSRLLESGMPGKAFAIRDGNENTIKYLYGTNGKSEIFGDLPAGEYLVNVTLTPTKNGENTAETNITDRIGNTVAHWIGAPGEKNNSPADSYVLDPCDHPVKTDTPNYYDPPTGKPEDWQTLAEFNTLNLQTRQSSTDENSYEYVYDNLGRIRFIRKPDTDNNQRYIYNKYDSLDRTTERGYYNGDWDIDFLQEKANQDWPQENDANAVWRYRYEYDGGDGENNAIGQISCIKTNRETENEEIRESFLYDIRGNTITRILQMGNNSPVSITYDYDMLNNILKILYPAFGSLDQQEVIYEYNMRGLVSSIGNPDNANNYAGYEYDAMGNISKEKLANSTDNPIIRSFTYNSPGWLKSIDDQFLEEILYYDDNNKEQSNLPLYNGLISAISYTGKGEDKNYGFIFNYDDVSRLSGLELTALSGDTINSGYAYDSNGNITAITDDVREDKHEYYEGTNRLKTTGIDDENPFKYLPSGEVSESSSCRFGYDYVSGLTQDIKNNQSRETLSLTYGATAQRLQKTIKSGSGDLFYRLYIPGINKKSMLERTWAQDTGKTQDILYIYGPRGLIALKTNDQETLFVLKDHEGANRFLVKSAGTEPAAVFNYLPFGRLLGDPGGSNPEILIYRYTGQEIDREVNLYNYRHRMYDPYRYCFYSPDPSRQYFSPYIYTGDDPILLTDPSGEFSFWGTIASAAEIAVGVASLNPALVATGAAGLNYSIRSDDFSWSQFAQVSAASDISAAEIQAGIAIDIISAGSLKGVVGDALTGAGTSGLANVFTQINTDPNGKFDWGDWGKQQAIGAVTGIVTGGVGKGIGSGIKAAAAISGMEVKGGLAVFSNVSSGMFSGAFGSAANTITSNLLYNQQWDAGLGQAMLKGMATGAGTGMLKSGASNVPKKGDGPPSPATKILESSTLAGLQFGVKFAANKKKWTG